MHTTSLLLGFFIGIVFIISLLMITLYIQNRRFIKKNLTAMEVSNEEVRDIISKKNKRIIKSTRIGFEKNFQLLKTQATELIFDIANYYYPNSKNPHLEISLMDALEMNERINQRLKKIFELKGIGMIKDIRISQIIKILEMKKNMEENKLYQFSKKYKLNKVVSYGYAIYNVTNPFYWLRRFIYTSTFETTLRGLSVMTLNIVGEEASRLYSKKIIDNRDKILDKEFDKFIKEIEMASNM